MPTTISGTSISTANLNLGGTFMSDELAKFASNNYLQTSFSSGVSNNYLQTSFSPGPASVIFEVGLNSGHVGATNVILWNDVFLNIGSHYDSSTGRFTAPTDGVYEFYWGGIKNNTSSVTRLRLRKNGVDHLENRLAEGDVYNNTYAKTFLSLSASDYVDINVTAGSFYGTSSIYGRFGGRLMGYS